MNKDQTYHQKFDSFYQSQAWRKLRAEKFRQAMGLCERCKAKGVIREGVEVHHIIPIDECWDKRLDFDNLELLCCDCHNRSHERISSLQKFDEVWEDWQNGRAAADGNAGQVFASEQCRDKSTGGANPRVPKSKI